MNYRSLKLLTVVLVIAFVVAIATSAAAQDMPAPSVEVSDQVSKGGTVTITSAYSAGPGFMVIHADNAGAPGPVIGFRWLNPGWNRNIQVRIDPAGATTTLYAMLHEDTGELGVYEFGQVEGADRPVIIDGSPITPPFTINLYRAWDQFVTEDSITVANVVVPQATWVVIHSAAGENPGPVLGQTLVPAGVNADVVVELAAEGRTDILWPMLHFDTGAAGTYEFGAVEGADAPIIVNDVVATAPIWTVPHARVWDQIVVHGDGMEAGDMAATVWVESVLSEGPGFLVIHTEQDGTFAAGAGYVAVAAGTNTDLTVTLDGAAPTPRLWPMLHVDTGAVGTYEFGMVEGADGPVMVNDEVVTFSINAAPSMTFSDQPLVDGTITIDSALIDTPGWLVVHGGDGAVLASYPLLRGLNNNIVIELDPAAAGNLVSPMLHYDTAEVGVYEFGTVEGADAPVAVGGNIVVAPLNITS